MQHLILTMDDNSDDQKKDEKPPYYSRYGVILVRYNELGLKSDQTRKRMEKTLVQYIHAMCKKHSIQIEKSERKYGRIFFYIPNPQIPKAMVLFKFLIGVYGFSPSFIISKDWDEISSIIVDFARELLKENETFVIRSRRIKPYPKTTPQIERELGAVIIDDFEKKNVPISVDLHNPDKTIYIEIREKHTYVYSEVIETYWGGNPLEGNKSLFGIWSKEIDSKYVEIASQLMLRRGVLILPVIFEDEGYLFNENLKKKYKQIFQYTPHPVPLISLPLSSLNHLIDKMESSDVIKSFAKKHCILTLLEKLVSKVNGNKDFMFFGNYLRPDAFCTGIYDLNKSNLGFCRLAMHFGLVHFLPLCGLDEENITQISKIHSNTINPEEFTGIDDFNKALNMVSQEFSVANTFYSSVFPTTNLNCFNIDKKDFVYEEYMSKDAMDVINDTSYNENNNVNRNLEDGDIELIYEKLNNIIQTEEFSAIIDEILNNISYISL